MAKTYSEAVSEAIERMEEIEERGEDAIGSDAIAFIDSLMTPEEIKKQQARVRKMLKDKKTLDI